MISNVNTQTLLKYYIGVIICSLGVVLVYSANLGSAPTSTFSEGLAISTSIQAGTANIWMNVAMFMFALLVDRKNIGIGSILSTFSFGIVINIWTNILSNILTPQTFLIRVIVCIIGIVIQAYGLSYYMKANLGYGALELVSDFFSRTFNVSFAFAKTAMDSIFMIVGYILGGAIGLGTVLATVLIGYLVDLFLKRGK